MIQIFLLLPLPTSSKTWSNSILASVDTITLCDDMVKYHPSSNTLISMERCVINYHIRHQVITGRCVQPAWFTKGLVKFVSKHDNAICAIQQPILFLPRKLNAGSTILNHKDQAPKGDINDTLSLSTHFLEVCVKEAKHLLGCIYKNLN